MYRLFTHLFLVTLVRLALAQPMKTAVPDERYDNDHASVFSFTCGQKLYDDYGYRTLSSIQIFPYVGGLDTISGPDSPDCGACYFIYYDGHRIPFLAIDRSREGLTLSEPAFHYLTGGSSAEEIDVSYMPAHPSACRLPSY